MINNSPQLPAVPPCPKRAPTVPRARRKAPGPVSYTHLTLPTTPYV